MAVRSKTLHKSETVFAANVDTTVYTVPAGKRTIIRSLLLFYGALGSVTIDERTGEVGLATIRRVTIAGGNTNSYDVWRVLEEGHRIVLRSTSAATLTVWISGAELVL